LPLCVLVGGLMAVLVEWSSGGQTLVMWAGSVLARASSAVTFSGVVSVMVSTKPVGVQVPLWA
jgi:hypothetical protein